MAFNYKILGQVNPLSDTVTTLYQTPLNANTVVSTLQVCNQTANDGKFRISVRHSTDVLASKHYLAYDTVVPMNDSLSLTIGLTMANTDIIEVSANNSYTSFNLFGSEIV